MKNFSSESGITLAAFLAKRAAEPIFCQRPMCRKCKKALHTCYCAALRPFASPVPFVILQHSDEARNAIATARMAHLSMTNSELIIDRHFENNARVGALLADETHQHLILYPSADAMPLDEAIAQEDDKRPITFWVLDAKWAQVPKMLRLSPNVRAIPRVKFNPEKASGFRIRRQPKKACLSTIESIHFVIEKYVAHHNLQGNAHAALLDVFKHLVTQQLGFVHDEVDSRHAVAKAGRRARRQRFPERRTNF